MSEHPGKRRWLRFRLSSLLWLTALVALTLFAVSEHRARRQAEEQVQALEEQNQAIIDSVINGYSKRADVLDNLDREIQGRLEVLQQPPKK